METTHIKVTNIPENVFDDYLVTTFGTVVPTATMRVVSFKAEQATAIIDVNTPEAVRKILGHYQRRPSWYDVKGQRLDVVEYTPLPMEPEPCTIRATGNVTKEQLKKCLDCQIQSVEGDIVEIEEKNKSEFRVLFDSDEAVRYVIEGAPFKVEGQELLVSRYRDRTPSYTDRVIIKGLSLDTTKDGLFNYLEAKVHVVPVELTYGAATDTVMVTFRGSLDFTKLETINTKVLDGSELTISRIPISNCVHVRNIDGSISDETLRRYFENHEYCNGDEVERVQRFPDEKAALLYFKDFASVDDILAQESHTFKGQTVTVHLYIKSLGIFKTPNPISVTVDPNKIRFLKDSGFGSKLESYMANFCCKVEWIYQIPAVELKCTLTEDVNDVRRQVGAWETRIKKRFRNFLKSNVHLQTIGQVESVTWDCLITQEQELLTKEKDIQCYYSQQTIMLIGSTFELTKEVTSKIKEKVEQLQTMTNEDITLQMIDLGETNIPRHEDIIANPTVCAYYRPNNCRIYIVKGDMTVVNVDVLVNSTDERMEHHWTLGSTIKTKGGHHIEAVCRQYIEENGRLPEGGVFVCSGEGLKAKYIVHAVGPEWHGGQANESSILEETVINAMQQASSRDVKSIAIPAISCGRKGYPVVQATQTITETVHRFLTQETISSIREFYLFDVMTDTVDSFKSALKSTVGSENVRKIMNLQSHNAEGSDSAPPCSSTRRVFAKAKFDLVEVTIVAGDIAKEHVDVMLNVTPRNSGLMAGDVSMSLNRLAGPVLQQELSDKYPSGINWMEPAETDGHNLPCKKVFHFPIEERDVFWCFLRKSLSRTNEMKMSSIAIPVLPTNYESVNQVADLMIGAVTEASEEQRCPHDVRLIIPPTEVETHKAFESQLMKARSKFSRRHRIVSSRALNKKKKCPVQ